MTFFRFLVRNLAYHWRGNLAVFLGIALASAVLTGALLVGDSLRGSLRALTLEQLGWVDQAMLPGRFFRAKLADDLGRDSVAPAIFLQGSASDKTETPRIPRVNVLGVDASFWRDQAIPEGSEFWSSDLREVVLNEPLAHELHASVGSMVTLFLQKADNVPREMLLGNRKAEDTVEPIRLKVRAILKDEGMARFSLRPSPVPARNAFVPIRVLQKALDLPGRANVLLHADFMPHALEQKNLNEAIARHLTLDDWGWGLRIRTPRDRAEALMRFLDPNDIDAGSLKRQRWSVRLSEEDALLAQKNGESLLVDARKKTYWRARVPQALADMAQKNDGILTRKLALEFYESQRNFDLLESRQMVLPHLVVQAVRTIENQHDHPFAESAIYLADAITDGKRTLPYAIVAAVQPTRNVVAVDEKLSALGNKEIILVDWPGAEWRVQPGKTVTVRYYSPDERNRLVLREAEFQVKDVVSLRGKLDDPDLTPEFAGITDQVNMANWKNPPFPYDSKRIKKSDEIYWERYRTTPRAYVSLETARKLWGTRFGDTTSIILPRVKDGETPLTRELLDMLKPDQGGFAFQDVRGPALSASVGANDFGVLFVSFSFFLIVASLLLAGLLVRLNLDRRASEIGLLLAIGWTHGRVRRLLLGEGFLLAITGSLLGLAGALLYAQLMLRFLAVNWPGSDGLAFLKLHVDEHSLIHGFAISLVASMATLWWALRGLAGLSPRSLLAGETTQSVDRVAWTPNRTRYVLGISTLGALMLALTANVWTSPMAQALSFFGSGTLMLTACLAGAWHYFKLSGRASTPQPSLPRLGIRNAGRNALRSVLTVGLLASASFIVVAVESFHKDTDSHFHQKSGGSGGFALFAEGNVPVFEDLNDVGVRRRLGLDAPELRNVTVFPCRVQIGDDASCLNLYKPLKPRLMGISGAMIERGGFHFSASHAQSEDAKTNPWRLLRNKDADAIPAFLDANTAQWILKVSLGDTVDVQDENGKPAKLRVVGLLEESIFQSEILIAEDHFLRLFPRQEGFSFLLIDTGDADVDKQSAIQRQLSTSLGDINMSVQTTASRLQGYLAVENMYLATFQALGGLGLVLGAAGLAIVLLRGVWERRAELALLQALGFRPGQLAWLVLAENAYLLVLGLAAGTASALLAVLPHLVGGNASVLWLRILALAGLVLAVGMVTASLAVWSTLKTPMLTALRRE